MKVAIVGAGLAGLACAHELEALGVNPVVYERRSFIGDYINHVTCFLQVMHRPVKDAIAHIRKEFGIDVVPLNAIRTIVHRSQNRTSVVKGDLGYFIKRGKDVDSFHNQLFSQLEGTKILFEQKCNYNNLVMENDFVIIANGNSNYTDELGCWQAYSKGIARGAVVLGDFDPNTLFFWVNRDYCKSGFAYLAPYDSKKASLNLIVTDVNEKEINHFWELFLYTENIRYTIVEEFIQTKSNGFVYPHRLDKVFFAGSAGGATDPFLGFGQLNAVTMGVMAARAIVTGEDYEKMISHINKDNKQKFQFREYFNKLANNNYDSFVSFIGKPGIKHLIYNTPLNVIKYGSLPMRLKERRIKS